jgi:hypothetical protein
MKKLGGRVAITNLSAEDKSTGKANRETLSFASSTRRAAHIAILD